MKLRPVIVIDGTTSGLAVVRSLGGRGVPVVVADFSKRAYARYSRYARGRITLPDPTSDEVAFCQALEQCAGALGGSLLIPCSDEALVAVSRNKARLGRQYHVGAADWMAVKQVIEKARMYDLAKSLRVPVPLTLLPDTVDDVRRFAQDAEFPCLVKPDQSHMFYAHFGVKVFMAADAKELIAAYQRSVDAGIPVLLQEFIPGPDRNGASISSYRSGARSEASFSTATVRSAPPFLGSPRVVVSRRVDDIGPPSRLLLDATGLDGFSSADFKLDPRDGTYKLLDVNARYNVSVSLAARCGIDFPWTQYRHMVYGEEPQERGFASGVYWIDVPSDVAQSIRHLGREQSSLVELVRPYARPHVMAVTSGHDPAPIVRRVISSVDRRLRRTLARRALTRADPGETTSRVPRGR